MGGAPEGRAVAIGSDQAIARKGARAGEMTDLTAIPLETLKDVYLNTLEKLFGSRDRSWPRVEVTFGGEHPQAQFPELGRVIIRLSNNARYNRRKAAFQLAHECVHVLSPGGRANYAEEGIAEYFAHSISGEFQLGIINDHPTYVEARRRAVALLALDVNAVRLIRAKAPKFSDWTPDLIVSVCKDCPRELADELCMPFPDAHERKQALARAR
jgi:hypothetical protein